MKDESRAKWPELKFDKNIMSVTMGGKELWYVRSPQGIEFSIHGDAQEAESRARQICALPAMVALLKRVMKDSVNEEMLNDTRALLESIGEVE